MKKLIATTLMILSVLFYVSAQVKLDKKLNASIEKAIEKSAFINEERKASLNELATYTSSKILQGGIAKLLFICTHNSRRSHIAQAWAWTASYYYGINKILTFSGGTEATAFNPRAVKALQNAGLTLTKSGGEESNPAYSLFIASNLVPISMFSKKYDHVSNPKSGFGAIMVCSEADKSCPLVAGAEERISLPYDDPKYFDNTPSESQKYEEASELIASEIFYLIGEVKRQLILNQESSKNEN